MTQKGTEGIKSFKAHDKRLNPLRPLFASSLRWALTVSRPVSFALVGALLCFFAPSLPLIRARRSRFKA